MWVDMVLLEFLVDVHSVVLAECLDRGGTCVFGVGANMPVQAWVQVAKEGEALAQFLL